MRVSTLGARRQGANPADFAFSHIAVALGTKTMAEMRDLAEV
jgi:hypothetical protein